MEMEHMERVDRAGLEEAHKHVVELISGRVKEATSILAVVVRDDVGKGGSLAEVIGGGSEEECLLAASALLRTCAMMTVEQPEDRNPADCQRMADHINKLASHIEDMIGRGMPRETDTQTRQ